MIGAPPLNRLEAREKAKLCSILIIGDGEADLSRVARPLRQYGFNQLIFAGNAEAALAEIDRQPPDLIILDPEILGNVALQFCHLLRSLPQLDDVALLIQSNLGEQDRQYEALRSGANDLISRPVQTQELIIRASIYLENRVLLLSLTQYWNRATQELDQARRMLADLLPKPAEITHIKKRYQADIAAHFQLCAELGGGMWGVRPLSPKCFGLFLIHFTGRGVGAALNCLRFQGLLDEIWTGPADPAQVAHRLDQRLRGIFAPEQSASLFLALVDIEEGVMTCVTAGTVPPSMITKPGAEPILLEGGGQSLGLAAPYETKSVTFSPGAALFVVSDTFVRTNPNNIALIGKDDFIELTRQAAKRFEAQTSVGFLRDGFDRRFGGDPDDDLIIVAIKFWSGDSPD